MNRFYLLILAFSPVIVSLPDSNVKLNLIVHSNKMTLSCSVKNRVKEMSIFLICPFGAICKENCKKTCANSNDSKKCLFDKMIDCKDRGYLSSDSQEYIIDYIIDGSNHLNAGEWSCEHRGESSSKITVEVNNHLLNSTTIKATVKTDILTSSTSVKTEINKNTRHPISESGNLLTKSEFILSVIALLAVSLIFNIFFCIRIIFVKCKFKKTSYGNEDYFSMQQNQRHFNRCNSQVSDPERIYEDTSTTQRQMSFMAKIKNSNGNYVGQSTLTPSTGTSTILPPNCLPLNHSMSFPSSQSDGRPHLINTPNQIYYPLPTDSAQPNYGAIGLNPENQYTNFLPVQSDLITRDANNQPMYLAFTPAHSFISTNGRYLQYSHQPIHMTAESTTSSNTKPSPVPSQLKNGLVSRSNSEQEDYQLSREMMEEADNLLRTADTLLKSTQLEMNMIHS